MREKGSSWTQLFPITRRGAGRTFYWLIDFQASVSASSALRGTSPSLGTREAVWASDCCREPLFSR